MRNGTTNSWYRASKPMTIILTSESSITLPAVERELGSAFFRRRFVCVSTAAAVFSERPWVTAEQECLRKLGAEVMEVELSTLAKDEAHRLLDDSDGIFIHGGNTFFLLQEMQRIGFKQFVSDYIASERPYIGSSAGSIVAGPRIDVIAATDNPSKAPTVNPLEGLHLVEVIPMVHFNDTSYFGAFRASFERAIETGSNVLPLRNNQFIISEKGTLTIVTAS